MSWRRTAGGRRTIWWLLVWLLIAAFVFYLPWLLGIAAANVSSALECPLAITAPQPCTVGGLDIGPIIFTLIRYQTFIPFSLLIAGVIALVAMLGFVVSFFRPKPDEG